MAAVVFDFDGTLLDSRQRHRQLLFECLQLKLPQLQWELLADYLEYKADGANNKTYLRFKFSQQDLSDQSIDDICSRWVANIEAVQYLSMDRLYPEAKTVLKELRSCFQLYLVTARQNEAATKQQIASLGLEGFFSDVRVVSPIGKPEEAKAAAIREMIPATRICCLIGDTEVDHRASSIVRTKFFALNQGFRSKAWWDRAGIYSSHDIRGCIDYCKEWK